MILGGGVYPLAFVTANHAAAAPQKQLGPASEIANRGGPYIAPIPIAIIRRQADIAALQFSQHPDQWNIRQRPRRLIALQMPANI